MPPRQKKKFQIGKKLLFLEFNIKMKLNGVTHRLRSLGWLNHLNQSFGLSHYVKSLGIMGIIKKLSFKKFIEFARKVSYGEIIRASVFPFH